MIDKNASTCGVNIDIASTLSSQYEQPQQAQDYLIISCIPFNSMLFVQLRSGLSRTSTTSFVKLVVTMFFAMLTNYAITGLSMVVPGSSVIFTQMLTGIHNIASHCLQNIFIA
ncbi:hypothetical protein GQX74_015188 [Glossina fuscipes]|nr:hypothetical protein GQX74_015188 [Glossina fuscipes]